MKMKQSVPREGDDRCKGKAHRRRGDGRWSAPCGEEDDSFDDKSEEVVELKLTVMSLILRTDHKNPIPSLIAQCPSHPNSSSERDFCCALK
ncbi:hypothetical protein U1Q18_031313 [Sarracenia purpurea var. burkii]